MKALVVTTSYPDFPGAQRGIFIRELCLELNRHGVEVMVLTPKVLSSSPYREDDCGIRVQRFWYPSNNTHQNQLEKIPVLPMAVYMISGVLTGLRTILKDKPDIIHGNWIVPTGLIASIIGRISGVPVMNTARGMDIRVRSNRAIKPLFDWAARHADRLTVVSPAMKTVPGLEKAEVITSGVDPFFFAITPARASKTVLYSRSLEPVYDAATLLKSIPLVRGHLPEVKLVIAGSGSQETDLKLLADRLGISEQVSFLGHVPHETVVGLAGEASVFVSTATADGTSIALLEAMAAGLTPVATDIDANRALITPGTDGFLFRPGDEKDLAETLIRALSCEISQKVLDHKKELLKDTVLWSTVAKRFITSYTHLVEDRRGHRG